MALAPIILFVYNRPVHTRLTIEALQKNKLATDSELFIYSDAPQNKLSTNKVLDIRNYIRTVDGFKNITIIEREKNFGLADSVILGVTEIIDKFGKAIVLEDDIVTSQNFLMFMNETLNFYESDNKIYSISGYNFPIKIPKAYPHKIYISPRPSSWGWATWQNRWKTADWIISDFNSFAKNKQLVAKFSVGGNDLMPMLKRQLSGKINSWAIRWAYTHFKYNSFSLYPINSFLTNIGADSSGTHTRKTTKFDVEIFPKSYSDYLVENLNTDKEILNSLQKFFSKKINLNKVFNIKSYLYEKFN